MQDHIRKWIQVAFVCAFLAVAGYEVYTNGEANKTAYPALTTSINTLNATLNLINDPCDAKDAKGNPRPGVICNANAAVNGLTSIAATAKKQIDQSNTLVIAAAANLNVVAGSANKEVVKLQDTTQAATDAAKQAKTDLADFDTVINQIGDKEKGVGPILAKTNLAIDDFTAYTKSKAMVNFRDDLFGIVHQTYGITTSVNGIAANGKTVSDKMTKDFMAPWYKKPGNYVGDFINIAGWATAAH